MATLSEQNIIKQSRFMTRLVSINIFPILAIILTIWFLRNNLPDSLVMVINEDGSPERISPLWSEAAIFIIFILVLALFGVTLSWLYARYSGGQTLSVTIFSVIFPAFSGAIATYFLEIVLRHLGVASDALESVSSISFASTALLASFAVVIYGLICMLILPKPLTKKQSASLPTKKVKAASSANPLDPAEMVRKQQQKMKDQEAKRKAPVKVLYADLEPNRFILLAVSMVGLSAVLLVWFFFEAIGVAVVIGIIFLILMAGYSWKVTVDDKTIRVKNILGIIRYRVPIHEINSLKSVNVEANWSHIFWGVSRSQKRHGVILSTGPALAIYHSGKEAPLVITVENVPRVYRFLHEKMQEAD